ncbi:MAG TPA: hypothetical protein VHO84_14645 [Syntrophorhabdaceae bacterium]|nr:hypothetical protein [Syntrophorhabdaceae bacterium]
MFADHWKSHVLIPDRHCYLWENPGGQVDGYLIYEIFDQSLPRVRSFGAEVKEIITLNHEARRSIFAFIKRLPPQIKKTVFRMPLPDLCHSYFFKPSP